MHLGSCTAVSYVDLPLAEESIPCVCVLPQGGPEDATSERKTVQKMA